MTLTTVARLLAALALSTSALPREAAACALAVTNVVEPIGRDTDGAVWLVHAHLERSPRGCAQHQVLLEQRRDATSTWYDIAPGMLAQSGSAPVAPSASAQCKHGAWAPHHAWRAMGQKWLARELAPLASEAPTGASVKHRRNALGIVFADGTQRTVALPTVAGDWVETRAAVVWESGSVAWVVRQASGSSAMHPMTSIMSTRIDAAQECPASGCIATLCTNKCVEPVKAASEVHVINVAADDHLNLRSEPSASSAVVAELPVTATCVRYAGENARNGQTVWLRVQSGDSAGWVNASFVEAHPVGTCQTRELR